MSAVKRLGLLVWVLAQGGCSRREAPSTRVLSNTGPSVPAIATPSPSANVASTATLPVVPAPLTRTLPCNAETAIAELRDAGLGAVGRIQCAAGDGGTVYSIALPVATEARYALALASIIRGHLATISTTARATEIAATVRDSTAPRGVPLGLYLRDQTRYAGQMGFVEGLVAGAHDVDEVTELEVTTSLGRVTVAVPLRAPEDVYAGQRVQAYGLWYRLEDGRPRLAAIVARPPAVRGSGARPAVRNGVVEEEEYE